MDIWSRGDYEGKEEEGGGQNKTKGSEGAGHLLLTVLYVHSPSSSRKTKILTSAQHTRTHASVRLSPSPPTFSVLSVQSPLTYHHHWRADSMTSRRKGEIEVRGKEKGGKERAFSPNSKAGVKRELYYTY